MTLAANAAIPAGLRLKAYDQSAIEGATKHAAGVLFISPIGRIFLAKRAADEPNFGDHWSLPGGGVEDGETPEIGAQREVREEIGVDVDTAAFKDLHKTRTPTGMAFHTFGAPVENEFEAKLNAEHSEAGWFDLHNLPTPLHPSVEAMLRDRVGVAQGMDEDGAKEVVNGLVAWSKAKEEPEALGADSALVLAMDKDTVREKTRDGRLRVSTTNISKANVCPYRGSEIPGWQALGLDPDRIYNLLRDPDELKKAAPTLNGVQLLKKHIPVSAQDHRPYDTVGSLGSSAAFDGEYLTNSLYVNAADAIAGIEDGSKRELSAGYNYTPDMTPGNFRGTRFDGVMRDIVFNHVALVEDGRAGPDVMVGDSMENVMAKPTRIAVLTLSSVAATVAPMLAMDSAIKLPTASFKDLTSKNFKDKKAGLLASVRSTLDGKMKRGMALDASMEGLAKVIDAFEELSGGMDEPVDEKVEKELEKVAAVEPVKAVVEAKADNDAYDSEPLKAFLKEKGMAEDDILKACGMLPRGLVGDESETEEEKAARLKREQANDEEKKNMVSQQAMDQALKTHGENIARQVRDTERGIRAAIADVKPYVGDLPANMAFDSGADVHRHALTMLGVDGAKTLHADALLPILKAQRTIADKTQVTRQQSEPGMAMDSSSMSKAIALAPGLANIRIGV